MEAVAADQGEEGREERAARRARALRDHADEFVDLDDEEAEPQARRSRPCRRSTSGPLCALAPMAGQAAGEARQQQAGRLDRDIVQVEQSLPLGPPAVSPDSTA